MQKEWTPSHDEGINGRWWPWNESRTVRTMEEVKESFERCSSEALTAFGDGSMFIERLIEKPRHIEVQILADETGDTVHLYDRDCSV